MPYTGAPTSPTSTNAPLSSTSPTTTTNRTKSRLRTLLAILRGLLLLISLYLLGISIHNHILLNRSPLSPTSTPRTRKHLSILILSAIATFYLLLLLPLTFLGHVRGTLVALILDLVNLGIFIAIAVLLSQLGVKNVNSCDRLATRAWFVPDGSGHAKRNCELFLAGFVLACVAAGVAFLAAVVAGALLGHFKKARPFGPGPGNGYHAEHNAVPRGKKAGVVAPVAAAGPGAGVAQGVDGHGHSHGHSHGDSRGFIPPMTGTKRASGMTDYSAYSGSTMGAAGAGTGAGMGTGMGYRGDPGAPVAQGFTDPARTGLAGGRGPAVGGATQYPTGGYEAYRAPVTRPEGAQPAPLPYPVEGRPTAF